ncbi:SPFH domain-containing protein [Gulosibacter molinativorax]|uniref:SPFH/Band 7/PHB domain protein n=1 Tax=Gulosibacter molinativorax TaxID=256821 RepID=A0ABT7C5H8_9MICO|nr:SPFH domain-containing protein [Gulosibacter molinativorax]MDJ1370457.1 SPFH/Band 7/PHB domain protein [Gulosibacter molinativorax]QUY61370.1 Modulator of FtsH protease HflK [Gulosibacter molinativorax]
MPGFTVGDIVLFVVLLLVILFTVVVLARAVRIVPQATALIIERLGRYNRTLHPGLHFIIPFIDRARANVDLREQVVSFPPQPVITSDNLVVSIDTVIFFQPTDPKAATYEIASYIQGIEQLTVTTLRNVIGSLDLEETLTSRDRINSQLRGVLDDATGRWGIRVNRVELKAIDPPPSVQESMEKQMRAERDRRATILNAEGIKQSEILRAEGDKQAQILRAEGNAQAQILEAQGEARAILQVFDAIHRGNADSKLLAYQYLQTLPEIAKGDSNTMWIVPSELAKALQGVADALGTQVPGRESDLDAPPSGLRENRQGEHTDIRFEEHGLEDPDEALRKAHKDAATATEEAEVAERSAPGSGARPTAATTPAAGSDSAAIPDQNP